MTKTLSFAALHFIVAFTLAYLLTGNLLLGSLIAMVEPTVNTVAYYFHDRAWLQSKTNEKKPIIKTLSFAGMHFGVAFAVTYLLTGDMVVGGVMALLEPMVNTVIFYFHEQVWAKKYGKHGQREKSEHMHRHPLLCH